MTTPPALPIVPGLAWSRHKLLGFKTRVAAHVSGREVRVALQQYPLYEFAATYAGMNSASSPAAALAGLGNSSLQALMGFFLQMQGQFGTFLYTDPDDSTVAGGAIATGDGATATFLIPRVLGGFAEPVSYVTAVTAVYLNGAPQPANNWLFTAPNSLGFVAAPGAGVAITADFTFAFQCRFLDDAMDFEEFMNALWKLDKMGFRSIKANTVPSSNVPAWYDAWMISATLPTLVADTTTEGGANNYYYNGNTYSSFAELLAALGITFSRASVGYYRNASGALTLAATNVMRFSYDSSGNPQGLLLEGGSTNLATYSSGAFNTHWIDNNSNLTIVDSDASGPDGTSDASTITDTSGTNQQYQIVQEPSLTIGDTYTLSVFAAPGTLNFLNLGFAFVGTGGKSGGVIFNLTTGAAINTQNTGLTISTRASQYGSYWRCELTISAVPSGTTLSLPIIGLSNAGTATLSAGSATYSGTGSGSIRIFGAQLEQSPFATSFIPTTSSTASRSADSLSAATWPAITAGTLYAAADTEFASQVQRLVQIDNNSENSRATLEFNASAAGEFDFLDAGSSEASLAAGTVTANTVVQLAATFQVNDFALVANGGAPAAASSGVIPSFSKLRLGQDASGGSNLFGHLRQCAVWNNLRGPNASLQSLT